MKAKEQAMFYIGCHLPAGKGYLHMGETAAAIGANTFQFFSRNPRGGTARALDLEDMASYNRLADELGIGTIVAHAPYTLNLCSDKAHIREFSQTILQEDLERLENIGRVVYNLHPGSHVGQGREQGIALIARALTEVLNKGFRTPLLLETMAGKGSEIGGCFEDLARILDLVGAGGRLGVLMDSCHVFDAGYDLAGDLDGVLDLFDRTVGLDKLGAFHLNDSLHGLGSKKDRHAKIGEGKMGLSALVRIINHPRLSALPFNLETPNDLDGYAAEIKLLKANRS